MSSTASSSRRPLLLEIPARTWVREWSRQAGRPVTLAGIPDEALASWAAAGFTHLWLMGVWTTGPRARQIYLDDPDARSHLADVCPDWTADDVPGSPYAVAAYEVDPSLGGRAGLAAFRARLRAAGLKLILDFVPNHVGIDHGWVTENPELLVHATEPRDGAFRQDTPAGPCWVAHGRDPWFPPWTDTAQVDLRNPETRSRLVEALNGVADQCDGVRCDMAMLGLSDVFARTWSAWGREGAVATGEFWAEAIASVRRSRGANFLFLAEAYWDLEEQLLALGFDWAYDKRVLDHLVAGETRSLAEHLDRRVVSLVPHGVHFLENHDEPRIAGRLAFERHQVAAMLILALPGVPLIHDGQLSGARVRASVHLARRPKEAGDPGEARAVAEFYARLLAAWRETPVGQAGSRGELLPVRRIAPAPGAEPNLSAEEVSPREGAESDAMNPAGALAVAWVGEVDSVALVVLNPGPDGGNVWVDLTAARMAEGVWEGAIRLVAGAGAGAGAEAGRAADVMGLAGRTGGGGTGVLGGRDVAPAGGGAGLRVEVRRGCAAGVPVRMPAWTGFWFHLRRASFL